jgi:hypothetical protein
VKALELVTVDLADPARVGVPVTAARPVISNEMSNLAPDPSPTQAGARTSSGRGEKDTAQSTALAALAEMLGVQTSSPDSVIERVRALVGEREALREAAITAAVARAVVLPDARGLVEELVRAKQPQTAREIVDAVAAVGEREDVRALLRAGLAGAMGPSQRRPVTRDGAGAGFFSW